MRGGFGVMKQSLLTVLPDDSEKVRREKTLLLTILQNEMTETQRDTWLAYYCKGFTIPGIANARSVNKSTVSRTLKRADKKIQRILKYL